MPESLLIGASRRTLFLISLIVALIAAGTALLLLTGGGDGSESPSDLAVEQVYRRASQTLQDSSRIYQVVIDEEGDSLTPYSASTRMWVDASNQVAHVEALFEFELPSGQRQPMKYAAIHTPEASYRVDDVGHSSATRSRTCYGADLATSVAVGCPGFTEESATTVRHGSYKGRKALVLVKVGTSHGSDETFSFTERLYLDPKTYLPVALVSEGTLNGEKPTYRRASFEIEWLPAGSLAPDFFEPEAIGYVAPDPEAGIRDARDLQVFWLGREFSAPGVERLVLKSSFVAPGRGRPYRYSLTYVRASNPFEPPFLTLQVFFREMWDSVGGIAAHPDKAVFLGDTVVFFSEGTAPGKGPILTPEELEQLKRGLRPYEVGP